MPQRTPHPWDVETQGPYIFNFSPSRDDFSRVRVGRNWRLSKEIALEGNEAAVAFSSAADASPEDSWLFSIGFQFRADRVYEAGVRSRLVLPENELKRWLAREKDPQSWLTLRLGSSQTPGAQNQLLACWTPSTPQYGTLIVGFGVPADGTYFFSIEAQTEPEALGQVAVGANAVANAPLQF